MELKEVILEIENRSNLITLLLVFVQTIFIAAGFLFGKRYLKQHKKKLLLEEKSKNYNKAIESIYGLMVIYRDIFGENFNPHEFENALDVVNKHPEFDRNIILYSIIKNSRVKSRMKEIDTLFLEIEKVIFHFDSPEIHLKFYELRKALLQIFSFLEFLTLTIYGKNVYTNLEYVNSYLDRNYKKMPRNGEDFESEKGKEFLNKKNAFIDELKKEKFNS